MGLMDIRAVRGQQQTLQIGSVSSRSNSSGYLLLDMALALTILLLLFAIVWPTFGGTTTVLQSATALDIATLLREDRTTAITTGFPTSTHINLDQRTLTSSTGRLIEVARDLTLEITTGATCMTGARRFTIVFSAEGRSCGGVIVLKKGVVAYAVRFNWLSGMIDVVHTYKG
jgi:general secretion pathway protein H